MKVLSKLFSRLKLTICLTFCLVLANAAQAQIQITNEFWISTNTNTANLGTLEDPFDGSTATKFDSIMNTNLSNCVFHILAGTYQTAGANGWEARSGQKISGSGMNLTILHLQAGSPAGDHGILNLYGTDTNIEVSDLTLDMSGSTNTHGVSLFGSGHAIRRVKVVNASTSTNLSATTFMLEINSSYATNASEGNIIEDCEVSQFSGGFVGAVCMTGGSSNNWISGTMRNNRIFLSTSATCGTAGQFCFAGGNARNLLIVDNYVNGTGNCFFVNGDPCTNVIISHNTFRNCDTALQLANSASQNISFSYNTIELADDPTVTTYGALFQNDANYTNITIIGNTFKYDTVGATQSYFISGSTVNGLVIANNSIEATMANSLSGCTGVNLYNNVDLFGNSLTNLNQIEPPNGVTRTSVSASYSATYADRYIGVKAASCTITLPSAVGRAGKEYVIADETGSGSASITVSATYPDTINAGASTTVGGAYSSTTVISDGTSWFAH